jgi:hypothetical protein
VVGIVNGWRDWRNKLIIGQTFKEVFPHASVTINPIRNAISNLRQSAEWYMRWSEPVGPSAKQSTSTLIPSRDVSSFAKLPYLLYQVTHVCFGTPTSSLFRDIKLSEINSKPYLSRAASYMGSTNYIVSTSSSIADDCNFRTWKEQIILSPGV